MFSKSTQQLEQAGTSGEPQQNVKKTTGEHYENISVECRVMSGQPFREYLEYLWESLRRHWGMFNFK